MKQESSSRSSSLVARAGQRFESARWLSFLPAEPIRKRRAQDHATGVLAAVDSISEPRLYPRDYGFFGICSGASTVGTPERLGVVLLFRLIANVHFRRTSLSAVGSWDDQDRSGRGPQYVGPEPSDPETAMCSSVVRGGDGLGLGRAALAQEDGQHDHRRDRQELALPVLERLEPEARRAEVPIRRRLVPP